MIPINLFLFVFLFFMLLVLLFTFFNVYHMVRYGRACKFTIVITTLYVVIVLGMIGLSMYFISLADWSTRISIIPETTNQIF
ncbi:hypothetical protein COV06_03380 [Candidatus Uhrbacteria bacterium CG10_big_fil_rev_8_21_14_0_10_50_16]|uniref:Uncharacterized protein n=1 Tax=Candidatus Uhrbacteria bacterium CG10_big_fil_rev_8_21_14_0_10_50_16 TaxID=1975039 RepID=A0A2H0RLU7_9BACT|nr:MAG: hypothetical protein COV06_03380 [Candidatus Uhrbacteria bacterium CG10_big_fil_rev_8_21_14_0_10_50_16]